MRRRAAWVGIAALIASASTLVGASPGAALTSAATPNAVLGVHGNQLISNGEVVRLLGVQPQGLESMCETPGYGYFDGPHNYDMVKAIKSWGANTVRVTFNGNCWLGRNVKGAGAPYRKQMTDWIGKLRTYGLFVVIDNHLASDAKIPGENLPMADDSAVRLWKSVAGTFKSTNGVVFDLYNEPHEISWKCWRDGCRIPAGNFPVKYAAYHSPGLQALVDAVRSTGAGQPIMLGGLDWANDDSQWVKWMPKDPRHQLIVSQHTYGPTSAACANDCRTVLARLAKSYPVVIGELGETDCKHSYIDQAMAWLDAHGIGYIGGAFNAIAPGSYQCDSPALLEDYNFPDPTPSPYGIGLRDHLRELAGL